MSYLNEFRVLVAEEAKARFLHLWEEYCLSDAVDGKELVDILVLIKNSSFANFFGEYAETALPLWNQIKDSPEAGEVLRILVDLQTVNSPLFAEIAVDYLTKKYGNHPKFNDFMRLSGLRFRQNFQGAISKFELLFHMVKGNFVFHAGGWGVGEILDVSLLREHVLIEFEKTQAAKDISFDNAFRTLIPLSKEHFLSRRFGDPDSLEKQGKEDPLFLMHLLLKDLGPKSALEIKEELEDLVIPTPDWAKWWQLARAKIKKDTKIKSPDSSKERFELRLEALSHEDNFVGQLKETRSSGESILLIYSTLRDFSEVFKNEDSKAEARSVLSAILEKEDRGTVDLALKLEASFLLEELFPEEYKGKSYSLLASFEHLADVLQKVDILAFRKEALQLLRSKNKNWGELFLQFVSLLGPNHIRDYLFKELSNDKTTKPQLLGKAKELLNKSTVYPEAFFWYFQKVVSSEDVPLADKAHQQQFLEAFLVLLHYIEDKEQYHELSRKMHHLITDERYLLFRKLIENGSMEFLREVLLLASKCQIFSKQDLRILQSLSEVVQPELTGKKSNDSEKVEVIWTTAEGFKKMQERIQVIGTVEMIENAKEIEAARALGDLKENSEYKYAQERRARLQGELKTLSKLLQKARILTKQDVTTDEVMVGTEVHVANGKGQKSSYVLLGPWDADPEKNILSFQSKLALSMIGKKRGEKFDFQGEQFTILDIKSFV